MANGPNTSEMAAELEELRARLAEAEETLDAIRNGEVDAVVVRGPEGHAVYTLTGAERVYRLLVEAMNEGALVLSRDGSIVYSNHTFAAMLGVPLEQVIGSSVLDYVSDSDQEAVRELLNAALWAPGRKEIVFHREGEARVPAHISLGSLDVEEAESISAVVTDLTEHKALECELETYREHLEELVVERTRQLQATTEELEAANEELGITAESLATANQSLVREIDERQTVERVLRDSEARFRAVFDSTQDAIVLADDSGVYVEANAAAEVLFGVGPGELVGRLICDFMEGCYDLAAAWSSLQQEGTGSDRLRIVRPDGSARDIEGHAVANIVPGRHLSVMHDVTERARWERELAATRAEAERWAAQLESFLDNMVDGVTLFDADGRMVMMNDTGKAIFGAPPGEHVDDWSRYQRYSLDGEPIAVEDAVSFRALRGETIREERYRAISPWGRDFIISVSASPVRDASGRIIGATNVFRDATDQAEFERRRDELFEREHLVAQTLQDALIPSQVPRTINGWNLATRYLPALEEAQVGGDFYDVLELGDGRVGVLIGDIAGKGLAAAIQVAAIRYAVRSYAYVSDSPAGVMTHVNNALVREMVDERNALTAFYAVLDGGRKTMVYANAGHEPPVIRDARGAVRELAVTGPMLGFVTGFQYSEDTIGLEPGDSVVMVTDGITEARTTERGMFGKEGVIDRLTRLGDASPDEVAEALLQAATLHAGGNLQDDVAIVVLERSREPAQ